MKVPLAEILRIEGDCRSRQIVGGWPARARAASPFTRTRATSPAAQEINVIGCTVEEATRRVDKFLDEAALAGKPERAHHPWLRHRRAAPRAWANFCPRIRWSKRIHAEAEDRGGNGDHRG